MTPSPELMHRHTIADSVEPVVRGLGPDETVWSVVRSPAEVLVGTDRRLFRLSEDHVDEWTYTAVDAIYGVDGGNLFVVVAGPKSFPVRIPPGPEHEHAIQELTILALLVGLAHRASVTTEPASQGRPTDV